MECRLCGWCLEVSGNPNILHGISIVAHLLSLVNFPDSYNATGAPDILWMPRNERRSRILCATNTMTIIFLLTPKSSSLSSSRNRRNGSSWNDRSPSRNLKSFHASAVCFSVMDSTSHLDKRATGFTIVMEKPFHIARLLCPLILLVRFPRILILPTFNALNTSSSNC